MKSRKKNKRKPAERARAESKAGEKFDERLFNRKLSKAFSDLPINFIDAINRALLESHETGADWSPMYFVDRTLAVLSERRLLEADRICREVWQIAQGKAVTPEFVRDILEPKAMEQIAVVEGYVTEARDSGNITWEPEWSYMAGELGKLKSEIVNRYAREIEGLAKAILNSPSSHRMQLQEAIGEARERRIPDVAKRDLVVKRNRGASAIEMCEIFDRENVVLLRKWQDAGLKSWVEAFKNPRYKGRIEVIVSKHR